MIPGMVMLLVCVGMAWLLFWLIFRHNIGFIELAKIRFLGPPKRNREERVAEAALWRQLEDRALFLHQNVVALGHPIPDARQFREWFLPVIDDIDAYAALIGRMGPEVAFWADAADQPLRWLVYLAERQQSAGMAHDELFTAEEIREYPYRVRRVLDVLGGTIRYARHRREALEPTGQKGEP